jgi:hypothetical protein
MSTTLQVSSTTPNFQPIFDKALKEYRKKTGKELDTHPLAVEIRNCDSPETILTVLREKASELNESQSSDERFTKWLTPTVNVLNALSTTVGEGVSVVSASMLPDHWLVSNVTFQVFPPTKAIFSGISILLVVSPTLGPTRLS